MWKHFAPSNPRAVSPPISAASMKRLGYLTALPAKKLLAAKLHDAVLRVQEQLARREEAADPR
jgi:hypothetical protein